MATGNPFWINFNAKHSNDAFCNRVENNNININTMNDLYYKKKAGKGTMDKVLTGLLGLGDKRAMAQLLSAIQSTTQLSEADAIWHSIPDPKLKEALYAKAIREINTEFEDKS